MSLYTPLVFCIASIAAITVTSGTALLCAWLFACQRLSLTRYFAILIATVVTVHLVAGLAGGLPAFAGAFTGLLLVGWSVGRGNAEGQGLGVAAIVRFLGWNSARAALSVVARLSAARGPKPGGEPHDSRLPG